MNTEQKSFIEELRSLSEPAKRRVFWGAVAGSMIVVVYLWLACFNTIVPSAAPVSVVASQTPTADTGESIFGLFADAAGSFWQAVGSGAQGIVREMKNPKQYNIGPR